MTTAIDEPVFGTETEARLLIEFRRAAAEVPAYRVLLDQQGVRPEDVTDAKKIALSLKPLPNAAPEPEEDEEEDDTPPAPKPERKVPLKGGLGDTDPNPFSKKPT